MTTSTLTALYAFAAGLATSGVAFSGAFVLWLSPRQLERLVPNLVALAVGVLLGDAFIHLIPDTVARHGDVGEVCLAVLGGMFLFFSLEKWVRWRHDHTVTSSRRTDTVEAMARMNLIGDAVHNFIDGILIAGSFWIDPWIGTTTTLAIIAHEIPQEIGDVGALIHGGYQPGQAIRYNFYCSLTVLAGIGVTLLLGHYAETSLTLLLPVAAGGFIYIAASDFIPALHARVAGPHWGQIANFALGIGLMRSAVVLEQLIALH
ncbi:MAG: ZIP family metal transporter [Methylococcus sp.]